MGCSASYGVTTRQDRPCESVQYYISHDCSIHTQQAPSSLSLDAGSLTQRYSSLCATPMSSKTPRLSQQKDRQAATGELAAGCTSSRLYATGLCSCLLLKKVHGRMACRSTQLDL